MSDKIDINSLTDEEFSKLNSEDLVKTEETTDKQELTSENTNSNITNSDTSETETSNLDANNSTDSELSSSSENGVTNSDGDKVDEPNFSEVNNNISSEQDNKDSEKADLGNQSTTPSGDEDKLSWYEKLTKPFKANGQEFSVKSPEESIKLMQKGLNYTKKMKALAADRKLAETFKAANITTPEEIGFIIDLKNGNKEAIKQLLKQHKIDPNDLIDYSIDDSSEDSSNKKAYTPTVPKPVDDQYLELQDHIEEISSQPHGSETINMLMSLDDESKSVLYNNPSLINSLYSHQVDKRPSGLSTYQEITNEMERMKALGELPANMPFVYAYKTVGDKLYGAPENNIKKVNNGYLGTSKGTLKQDQTKNDSKVKQAITPRSGSTGNKVTKDIFSMTDEEFEKLRL